MEKYMPKCKQLKIGKLLKKKQGKIIFQGLSLDHNKNT